MKILVLAFASLAIVSCSTPAERDQYDYLLMHYEADPDNETDPEHVIKAFKNCLASKPITEAWKTDQGNPTQSSTGTSTPKDGIAAEAMRPGSKLQALVDRCMTAKGYRTVS